MPLPQAPYVGTLMKAQLTAAGAPGAIAVGATQVPFNPLHRMADIMLDVMWPQVLAGFQAGIFVGSVGGPSAVVSPPAPMPFVSLTQMQADIAIRLPIVPVNAQSIAAQNTWSGPFAAALPTGVAMGVLMALNSSPFSIAATPADPVFLNLISGFVELQRAPLTAQQFVPQVLAAWNADPDLGVSTDRFLMANAMVGAVVDAVNSIQLGCGIVNPSPPATTPAVPGVPYPGLPLVFT